MEQVSYIFHCHMCGCNELLAKYRCESVVAYPVTKLVENDMRRDKEKRKEVWHGREQFEGYVCARCGWQFSSMGEMFRSNATSKFEV